MIWLTILLMALVVFASRYLFLEPKLPLRLSQSMLKFLSYSAPAVLTAILAPIVFIQDGVLNLSFDNSYLISAIFAILIALITRNTLLTTVLSMGLFFLIH
jgi:branched-subunit amino acid transport protein